MGYKPELGSTVQNYQRLSSSKSPSANDVT